MTMHPELDKILSALKERFGTADTPVTIQEFRDLGTGVPAVLVVAPARIVDVARALRDEYGFAMLSDETAVDYGPQSNPGDIRFHVVYQLRNLTRNLLITLRVPLAGNAPHLASLAPLYPGASWLEREVYDMFGITYEGHPDLRRIIMPYDWQGHPLRKDYPLGYEEVQFTFNQAEIMARKPHPKE